MRRGRSFPQQLVHWTYACVCAVLVLLSFVFTPLANLVKDSTAAASAALPPPPEGNGYTYSRSIAINHTKVPNNDQANFPVLISGTYSYLATVAHAGNVQNTNGYDVVFTSDSGCVTKLDHEVESYNATTGAVDYWVKVPTLSHTSDTTIYMCYGNSSITTDQSNKTAVWDANYKGVWHLPNGTNLTANDSTGNGNNGTVSGAMAASGQVDGAAGFDGTDDYVSVSNNSSLHPSAAVTFSLWFKATNNVTSNQQLLRSVGWLEGTNGYSMFVAAVTSGKMGVALNASSFKILEFPVSTNTWYHAVGVYDGSNFYLYVNGSLQASAAVSGSISYTSGSFYLGSANAGFTATLAGLIDEARVSSVVRSADWIATEYNNQSSPSTFYTISGESGNQPPVANAGGPYSGLSQTSIQFNGGGSSDPDGPTLSYAWDFGDPTSGSNSGSGVTGTHSYSQSGPYMVTLTVTDNSGATASATASVTATNRVPVANAGGPYSGLSQTSIQFNGSGSSDPDGPTLSYAWDFGDPTSGSNSGSGVTGTHSYSQSGTYTVTLTVNDNSGASATATANATVTGTLDARLDPLNRTGGGGEDPLSRNFNWSIPLVDLPGRAGLDLGLSLAYNSLATWTRNGSSISFDDDRGSPSPGFRLGFPVIQASVWNPLASKNSFILIMPSGSRVELRQVGTSNFYQSVDSSYLLLDASNLNNLILRTTDGTRLSYAWKGSDYQCTEIKDRNGNFITVNYDTNGRIDTVVDTLERTITFNYGADGLSTITQTWTVNGQPQTHTWASFTYANPTINTNFSGLTVTGPANNSTIKVLAQVTLADGSHFTFTYTSWGQVWKISQYTGETNPHLLNHRSYNLPLNNSTAQTDCPRFTERRDWAENWNGDTNGVPTVSEEALTTFAEPTDAALPDGSLPTVTRTQITLPDQTYQQIYFAGSVSGGAGSAPAWKRGLPLLTDTYGRSDANTNIARQRSVTTSWTQDDETVSYQLNPRATESHVYDFNSNNQIQNHARTRVEYVAFNLTDGTTVHLPENVKEYQADATTVLRRTHTKYRTDPNNSALLDPAYANLRIIGLVSEKTLYEVNPNTGAETLMSKVGYEYDEGGSILGNDAPVQHDTSYNASFIPKRANLSSVKRYDVTNGSFTTSTIQYNTAGAVVATADPLTHGVAISYADSFSNGSGGNTLAYPTEVTDAGGFLSSVKYNYDFGGMTRKQTPSPNVTEAGPVQTIEYDAIGRLQRITSLVNNAYTRYIYGPNYVETFATVNTVADEAHSLQVFDGHGRVIGKANNHPGSVSGFSGQLIIYDPMGRPIKSSNPTETAVTISATLIQPYGWTAAGDDAQAGWIYTQQNYDWKGRPLVTTNPSTTGNPADTTTKTASYAGCGCAGGEVVTLTDEGTIDGGVAKRRQQKIYSDILGRTVKTEMLNWEGGSVYSTTTNSYNARDQVTRVRQYQGADTSSVYQDTTTTYDGYGRPKTKHAPQQQVDANNALSTDHTTWNYNNDDTVLDVTDARGVVTTLGYNSRRLVTSITYPSTQDLPTGVPATGNVTFTYDAAGNRVSMSDGNGSTSYVYNQLSQMTSETRTFTGLSSYMLGYDYNLAGELKKITDPTNSGISYGFDSAGRLSGVTGSDTLFASVSTYASNFQYRAFGGIKGLTYGNAKTLAVGYDNRLQASSFEIPDLLKRSYQRYDDGSLKFTQDQLWAKFDRSYKYDHMGRITTALSGAEARGSGPTDDRPYNETNTYDAMDHLTSHAVLNWDTGNSTGTTFTNNRNSSSTYDADGRVTASSIGNYAYDAAAHINSFGDSDPFMTDQQFDGDGNRVKSVQRRFDEQTSQWVTEVVTYYVNSTVLGGQLLTELTAQGTKQRTLVYAGQSVLALQNVAPNSSQSVTWEHRDASGASLRMTDASGQGTAQAAEMDPMGANAGLFKPFTWTVPDKIGQLVPYPGAADLITNPGGGCVADKVPMPCEWLSSNNSAQCPNGDCRPERIYNPATQLLEWRFFQSHADGRQGYLPLGATSNGEGGITLSDGTEGWGYLELSRAGLLPQKPEPLTGEKVEKLETNLQAFLDDPECGKFINAFLGSLPADVWKTSKFDGSLMKIFERIKNGGGFWSGDTLNKYGALARTDPMTLTTVFDSQKSAPLINNGQSWQQLWVTVLLVHELTHIFTKDPESGTYGHEAMAIASSAAANSVKLDLKSAFIMFPTPKRYANEWDYDTALAQYQYTVLAYACRKVKL